MEELQRYVNKGSTLILKGYIVCDFDIPGKTKLGRCLKKNGCFSGTWGKEVMNSVAQRDVPVVKLLP